MSKITLITGKEASEKTRLARKMAKEYEAVRFCDMKISECKEVDEEIDLIIYDDVREDKIQSILDFVFSFNFDVIITSTGIVENKSINIIEL